jgi:DNA polymerase-3 subunit alpha
MENFPSYPSIHACGMLITEAPVRQYLSTFIPPKGFPTAMMDMFVAESIGINKFDILSQRGLGHIRTALEVIKRNKGVDVNIHDFKSFRKDEKIKKQIREANTIGCFYIESPAMRQLLKKLKCDDYLTLVAASSIIRPGVAQSGMMREYIERYHNRDKVKYLHPLFEEHLSETFGVMVFQEDVIKIAHYFAGLDLGEADVLRRAMSGKYRSSNQFSIVKEKFFTNCKKLGYSDDLTNEVWRQMESFAGYSFNKAHSASFAVESYMSLYLKTYFPKEFMVSVINNFGGFYPTELYFLELLKTGGNIHPPCINTSERYTIIKDDEVYPGLVHLKDLQKIFMDVILEERTNKGPYLHLHDFIERTSVTREQLNILISAGCFGFMRASKKRLLWEANFLQAKNKTHVPSKQSLFQEKPLEFQLPELTDHPLDDLYDQLEILGFPLCNPFALVDEEPDKYVYAKDLDKHIGKNISVLIYFIAYKVVPTVKNENMSFGTFIDAQLNWIDTVHFPQSFKRYPIEKSGFYKANGRVMSDFDVCTLEVHYMEKVGYKIRHYEGI